MINPSTGSITFNEGALNISPTLKKNEFLDSSLFKDAEEVGIKGEYGSWAILVDETNQMKIGVCLRFQKERLTSITLIDSDEAYGESWNDWSEEKELKRKESHDHILYQSFGHKGAEYNFEWGTVTSIFDHKSGSCKIDINYKLEPVAAGQRR
jgi:hypothetical protein